jgi:hypothetical protein
MPPSLSRQPKTWQLKSAVLARQIQASRNEPGAIDTNRLVTDRIYVSPFHREIAGVFTITNSGIEIRDRIKSTPFVRHADIELARHPESASPVLRSKIDIWGVNPSARFVVGMEDVLR